MLNHFYRWMAAAAVLALGFQTQAGEAFPPSNKVPSEQLIAAMTLIKSPDQANVVGGVILYQEGGHGTEGPRQLTMSEGEAVVFSVGSDSVTCNTESNCLLPYVDGAVYKAEFRRYNSEIYQSEVVIPAETRILSPAKDSLFAKDQLIDFQWKASAAPTRGLAVSTFLGNRGCYINGSLLWEKDDSATVPAKYISGCTGPVDARFTVFYVKVSGIPRLGGGSLKGYAMDQLPFTFVDDDSAGSTELLSASDPLSPDELKAMVQEIESPSPATTVIVQ